MRRLLGNVTHTIGCIHDWIASESESGIEVLWYWILFGLGALVVLPACLAWHYGPARVLYWIDKKRERKTLPAISAHTQRSH